MHTYETQTEITKYFLSGLLEGLTITENMPFLNWADACDWAGRCTLSSSCNFVVLNMKNLNTGQEEQF